MREQPAASWWPTKRTLGRLAAHAFTWASSGPPPAMTSVGSGSRRVERSRSQACMSRSMPFSARQAAEVGELEGSRQVGGRARLGRSGTQFGFTNVRSAGKPASRNRRRWALDSVSSTSTSSCHRRRGPGWRSTGAGWPPPSRGSSRGGCRAGSVGQAVVAHLPVTEERAAGAQQAVVVQRGHHWPRSPSFAGGEHRRAQQREGVVDVDDVGPEAVDAWRPGALGRARRPDHRAGQQRLAHLGVAVDLVARHRVQLDVVADAAQLLEVLLDHAVLAARRARAVEVVDEQRFSSTPRSAGRGRRCRRVDGPASSPGASRSGMSTITMASTGGARSSTCRRCRSRCTRR